jgi:LytR cell envelope-related transcriptional attenuator
MVIALLLALNSNPQRDTAGPALVSPTPTSASASPAPTPPTARPTPTRTTPATRVEAKRTSRPPVPLLPVSVLNNSTRSGLAHRAAAQVAAQGWPIAKVGNFTGRVALSTLYYAPGQFASAQRLAQSMSAIRRVLPRFSGLPTPGLTLVVTRDWPA